MSALYKQPVNPLDPGSADSNPNPQPFTGGSNIAPMPVTTKGNPFTDVLGHVDAFNRALSDNGSAPPPPARLAADATATPGDSGTQKGDGNGISAPGPWTSTDSATLPPAPPIDPNSNPRGGHPSAPPQSYTDANPPPHPGPNATHEEVAAYYRLYGTNPGLTGYNPAFANITADDVNAYQSDPRAQGSTDQYGYAIPGMKFGEWYLAGNRAPVAGGTDPAGNPIPPPSGSNPLAPPYDPNGGVPPSPPSPGGTPPGGTPPIIPPHIDPVLPPPPGTPPPAGTPPPPGTPPGTTPPPPAGVAPPDIQSLIDMFQKEAGAGNGPNIESMLNPMFARQRQKLDEQLRAQAALTPGRVESGGFGMNEGQALTDLSGQQSAKLADLTQQEHLAQMTQNTQLMGLATTAGMQKYTTDINADLTKFQVNSNADLQKWLDSADNVLKKYGIDTQDVLSRYQAELQLKGTMYSADKGVDAAALNAAAAHAAAAASAAASEHNAALQYQLGMQGLNVDREKNIGSFVLGLLGLGNLDINSLNGILNGLLPGTTVVKP